MSELLGAKLRHLWKTTINDETGKTYSVAEITVKTDRMGNMISHGYWYKMLKGDHKPSAGKLFALSKLFGVSVDYLLDDNIPVPDLFSMDRVADIKFRARSMSKQELKQVINDLQFMLETQAG